MSIRVPSLKPLYSNRRQRNHSRHGLSFRLRTLLGTFRRPQEGREDVPEPSRNVDGPPRDRARSEPKSDPKARACVIFFAKRIAPFPTLRIQSHAEIPMNFLLSDSYTESFFRPDLRSGRSAAASFRQRGLGDHQNAPASSLPKDLIHIYIYAPPLKSFSFRIDGAGNRRDIGRLSGSVASREHIDNSRTGAKMSLA